MRLKHGLTARVALLPEEDVADVKLRMIGVYQSIRPANGLEAALAENVSYSFVRAARASRAQTARLCRKIRTGAQEEAIRIERDVRELTQILFRPPLGRPAAHPFAEQKGGAPAEARTEVVSDGRDHPAFVVGRLEESTRGCQWLRPAGMSWVHFSKMD